MVVEDVLAELAVVDFVLDLVVEDFVLDLVDEDFLVELEVADVLVVEDVFVELELAPTVGEIPYVVPSICPIMDNMSHPALARSVFVKVETLAIASAVKVETIPIPSAKSPLESASSFNRPFRALPWPLLA